MTTNLNRVRKGDPITADAWNEVVDKVNGPINVSLRRGKRHIKGGGADIRPAKRQTAWQSVANGVYKATARFVNSDGTIDNSFTFDVWALIGTAPTLIDRFFVIWRDRWEAMLETPLSAPRYTSGDHIQVSGAAGPDGYAIDNKGLCEAKLVTRGQADSYADTGTLYLGGNYFKWVSSTLDIVGKKELWLKTGRTTVVTGVTKDANGNLNVTTKEITHLADS